MNTLLCLNETHLVSVGAVFAPSQCMNKQASLLFTLLFLLQLPVRAQSPEDSQQKCFEAVEQDYAYHTEVLLHIYDRAIVSPKEFEKKRSQLVNKRESELNKCDAKMLAEMEQRVDQQFAAAVEVISQSPSGSRSPASLVSIKIIAKERVPEAAAENQERALRRDHNPQAEMELGGQSHNCPYDHGEDEEPVYNGERVPVSN